MWITVVTLSSVSYLFLKLVFLLKSMKDVLLTGFLSAVPQNIQAAGIRQLPSVVSFWMNTWVFMNKQNSCK